MNRSPHFHVPDPVHVSDDVRFYYRHARRSQHPVLELGLTDGRCCLAIAAQEIPVVVLHPDADRLARLQALANQHGAPLSTHVDMFDDFDLERMFGMIYLPAGQLTQVVTFDEQRALLRRIRRHLPIGGKLAFDVPVPRVADIALNVGAGGQALTMRETHTDAGEDETVYVWERFHYDTVAQIETHHEVHERVDAGGTSLDRSHRVERRTYFWPREVRALLTAAGYMIEAVYGGFNDEPLTAESQVQVWLARRPIDEN